jgi:hypothetical protein
MSSRHPRFTTLCQQLLTLGVVCAALTPAATVMTLELVPEGPGAPHAADAAFSAYTAANQLPTTVPTEAVDPVVREVALTAPAGARLAPGALKAQTRRVAGGTELVSTPQRVDGYGSIGVTWAHGVRLADDAIGVQVRTRTGDTWSGWSDVEYHEEHGPDPTSPEGRRARPGTEPVVVGDVDQVQVKIDSRTQPPSGLTLALIDPGTPKRTARELPAIDTGTLPSAQTLPDVAPEGDGDEATLSRARVTPRPKIYSRAQWGANERLRDKSSLRYYEVHAGFVHHTVNANDYRAADVPGILRSIYAYHTRSRGWSDIGYNFLVDRFGRVWEGRAGGVDRAVVGAHTLGYNDYSFAMSAIGNFETARPGSAMLQAYGALFGWKLSLHGIRADAAKRRVGDRYFRAINGHRDAGSTACPGRHLYAQLSQIRQLATRAQVSFAGRQLESDYAYGPAPDLVVRRASDKRVMILPIVNRGGGTFRFGDPVRTNVVATGSDKLLSVGDWDRDGHNDLVTRNNEFGSLALRLGRGDGTFERAVRLARGFGNVELLAAVGDVTGDGRPDLMGQWPGGSMRIWPGNGTGGLKASYVAYGHVTAGRQIGIGRWNGDGAPDSLFGRNGKLMVHAGNGPGGLVGSPRSIGLNIASYDWVTGISDVNLTGHPDVVVRDRATGKVSLIRATSSALSAPVVLGWTRRYDLVG